MNMNNWAIVGDRGTEFVGSETDIRRIWKKINEGAIQMPGRNPRINYRLLVEIHEVRR